MRRFATLFIVTLALAGGRPPSAPAAGAPAPPGEDGFSETAYRGASPTAGPAIAVTPALEPRIAVMRAPAGELEQLDLIRRDGGAWTLELVSYDVNTARAPAIRTAADGSTHLAWVNGAGGISVGTYADGRWTASVAAPPPAGATPFAFALAPDGADRVLFQDTAADEVRLALRSGGGWTEETAGTGVDSWISGCALEVASDGTTFAAWADGGGIPVGVRAPTGEWTREIATAWGGTAPMVMTLDASGQPALVYFEAMNTGPAGYGEHIAIARRTRDGWTRAAGFDGQVPHAIGFGPGDSLRGVTGAVAGEFYDSIATTGAPRWLPLDGGVGAGRVVWLGTASVAESETTVLCSVGSTGPGDPQFGRIRAVGGVVDPGGGIHAAYVDAQSGDLRYVTNRDPGRPAAQFADLAHFGGTAVRGRDFDFEGERLVWSADDTGTKNRRIRIHADTRWEGSETVEVGLTSAGPDVFAASSSPVTLTITEPPVVNEPVAGASFLPRRIDVAPSGRITVRAALQTGAATFDPRHPPVLRFGAQQIEVPYLAPIRGAWRYESATESVVLRRVGASPSRWTCDVSFQPLADERPAFGETEIRFESADVAATSHVLFRDGFRLGESTGWFDEPGFDLRALRGTTGPLGLLAFSGAPRLLAAESGVNGAVPWPVPVEILVNGERVALVPKSDFRRLGRRFVWRSGADAIELDWGHGTMRARLTAPVLPDLEDGVRALTLGVRLASYTYTVRTRVVVRDGRFTW